MSTSATTRNPPKLARVAVGNDDSRAKMVETIAAIDAATPDDIRALLEASTVGRGADYDTIIAELDAKPTAGPTDGHRP